MARQEILVKNQKEIEVQWEKVLYPMIELRWMKLKEQNPNLTERETYLRTIYELINEEKLPILTYQLSN